jgi:ADP-ribosylation factor GTPase-activating protein 1
MATDPHAAAFFEQQMEDLDNRSCCDCGSGEAVWASITHGIYLSIGAAGLHRSLGVKVSRVQSITMDSWKPVHLKMMQLGGNRRFNDFLKEHGIPEDMPIREKYSTRAADWYRKNLSALAEGLEPLAPLQPGTGRLPVDSCPTPEMKKLDVVFANIPCPGAMLVGGVHKASCESSRSCAKSLCEKLSSCFRVKQYEKNFEECDEEFQSLEGSKNSDVDRLLTDHSLPNLLLMFSQNAKRLQTLSSGNVQDISYIDC